MSHRKHDSASEYLYGINPVFEALRAGRRTIHGAYLNQSIRSNPRLGKLARLCENRRIPVEWVEKGRLIDWSGSRDHQGVVLRSSSYPYVPFEALTEKRRLLLLDNMEDPHNVGAILRSAEILGFDSVLLPKRGAPEIYPSVVKVSAGATEHLHICNESSANQYVKALINLGYSIIALDANGRAEIDKLPGAILEKLVLVVGGENKSVGQYILNAANHVVRIRQMGRIGSLNASVAAGIAMYTLSLREGRGD